MPFGVCERIAQTFNPSVFQRWPQASVGRRLGWRPSAGGSLCTTSPTDAWIDDPRAAFAAGTSAYYSGDVQTALQALEAAAEGGHAVARWKLARMYAQGDGVAEDDARAFTYFSQIANAHAEDRPDTPRARFVANAFVAIAGYYNSGIGGVLSPDHTRSRQIFSLCRVLFR